MIPSDLRMFCTAFLIAAAVVASVLIGAPTASAAASASVTTAGGFNVSTIPFNDGYSYLFGDGNLVRLPDARSARLLLTRYSGSGFISSDYYTYGFFSASIKLPADYTAGVVVAFYTSNGDAFEKTHDELDFEFLGNVPGKAWLVQTNIYGNGSTARGREERYVLPFDPTRRPHQYSILWTKTSTVFYVDDVPIRILRRSLIPSSNSGDYPLKPMALYATIWDGSDWATESGKYKVNYKYSPFASDFSHLVLRGCPTTNPSQTPPGTASTTTTTASTTAATDVSSSADDEDEDYDPIRQIMTPPPSPDVLRRASKCAEAEDEFEFAGYASLTPAKVRAMREFRKYQMVYSYCYDSSRYVQGYWPECVAYGTQEKDGFWPQTGQNKLRIPQTTSRKSAPVDDAGSTALPGTGKQRRRRSRRTATARSAAPANVQTSDATF